MWALSNATPYAAESTWVRDKNGAHYWIVVVKATFDIADDGKLSLADTQLPPLYEPEYWGEPGLSSIRYEADLVAFKPGTDVVVNAHAHAPKGKPVRSVDVVLRIAKLSKTLRVFGTRVYTRGMGGLGTTQPLPFQSSPITYEWAYGGGDLQDPDPRKQIMDARNPVGKGVTRNPSLLLNTPAHGPAGFGAIASYWSPRRELAGTFDANWAKKRKPLLPADYDDRFTLCTPMDQRLPKHLYGGEQVALLNMTPSGLLNFELPKIYLTFTTYFGSRTADHRGKLVTVTVEPEDRRLIMAWQTSLHVSPQDSEYLDETLIREKAYVS